jgi:hypothetical protein
MTRRLVNTRHAISLVELLVVMSGCTVILTTSAMLIHRAMRTQSESRSFFDVERSALRLSGKFRDDVHRATAAKAGDESGDGVFLRLDLPGRQTVEYQQAGGNIERTLSEDGRPRSRDYFAFTPSSELEIREELSPRRLILTITSDPHDAPGDGSTQLAKYIDTPVSVRVEASLGRDWRKATLATGEEPTR